MYLLYIYIHIFIFIVFIQYLFVIIQKANMRVVDCCEFHAQLRAV